MKCLMTSRLSQSGIRMSLSQGNFGESCARLALSHRCLRTPRKPLRQNEQHVVPSPSFPVLLEVWVIITLPSGLGAQKREGPGPQKMAGKATARRLRHASPMLPESPRTQSTQTPMLWSQQRDVDVTLMSCTQVPTLNSWSVVNEMHKYPLTVIITAI